MFQFSLVLILAGICFAASMAIRAVDAQQSASQVVNAVAFADANVGVAVGDKGFIQRTEDGGKNWIDIDKSNSEFPDESSLYLYLTDVAFADAEHGIIIGNYGVDHGAEFQFLSDDGGKSWKRANIATPKIAANPDILNATSYPDKQHARSVGSWSPNKNGVLIKTDDGGASFQRKETNSESVLRDVSFTDADNGWIVGDGGTILHTTDGGKTFELQGAREDKTDYLSVQFVNKNTGWIVGADGNVNRTIDGGATWESIKWHTNLDKISAVKFADANNGFAFLDGVDAGARGILRTTDGGKTWQDLDNSVLPAAFPLALAKRPDGAIVAVGANLQTVVLQEGNTNNASGAATVTTVAKTATGDTSVADAASETKSFRQRVRETPVPISQRLTGIIGLIVLLAMLYLASDNRKGIEWRLVVVALGLQLLIALFILKTAIGFAIFDKIGEGISALLSFSNAGAQFVFGRLVDSTYADTTGNPAEFRAKNFGFIFAFVISATIIFVASLFSALYHLGIMQRVVYGMAWAMQRTLKSVSGAEALTVAAEVFMGQTEAPLTVAPYIPRMTKSELLAMMIGGMGTVSGGILAVYVGLGIDPVFLITTSVMAAPACLLCAKMLTPEMEIPETAGRVELRSERIDANLIDSIARGAGEGLRLALNVIAVLIAFIAFVAMFNALLGYFGGLIGLNAALGRPFGLEVIFSYLFAPLAFVMGVSWRDAFAVGDLFGTKLVLNELVAYINLAKIQDTLEPQSVLIATFALCGFANISSVGIIIGGIGGLCPARRSDLARLGWRALLGGFIATCLTATIAGILS